MTWRESLIKIANHEVDTLQKRVAEIVERREAAQMRPRPRPRWPS